MSPLGSGNWCLCLSFSIREQIRKEAVEDIENFKVFYSVCISVLVTYGSTNSLTRCIKKTKLVQEWEVVSPQIIFFIFFTRIKRWQRISLECLDKEARCSFWSISHNPLRVLLLLFLLCLQWKSSAVAHFASAWEKMRIFLCIALGDTCAYN